MCEQSNPLEKEVIFLREALERLETRVEQLESLAAPASPAAEPAADEREAAADRGGAERPPVAVEEDDFPGFSETAARAGANLGAGWIGAIILVLAGGFLLRALTESGTLSRALGTSVGLFYALCWAVASPLLAGRGRRRAATAAGLASIMVTLPLVWEACVHYNSLSPVASAGLLFASGVIWLICSERRRLALVTAVAVLGVGCASLAMSIGARSPEPFVLVLALLAIAAAFRGPQRGGVSPWFAYVFADLGALLLVIGSLGEKPIADAAPATGILAGLAIGSLAGFVRWSRRSGRAGAQASLQGTLATLVGFGGALFIAGGMLPAVATALASFALAAGGSGYVFLLVTFGWSRDHRWPFLLYSSLALALVALGAGTLFPEPAWFFAPLALILALVGVRLNRVSPSLHAAAAALLAAAVGGLAASVYQSLLAPAGSGQGCFSATGVTSLLVVGVCAVLPLKTESPIWPGWLSRLGRAVVVLVALLGVAGLIVCLAAPMVARLGEGLDPGALAALRTAVLSASVVALAAVIRWRPLRPARVLVWPLLLAIGIKLLAEDFPNGRAITLAISLLLGGGALILSAHLLRVSKRSAG